MLGDPTTYDTQSPDQIQTLHEAKLALETEQMTLEENWLLSSARIEEINELFEDA